MQQKLVGLGILLALGSTHHSNAEVKWNVEGQLTRVSISTPYGVTLRSPQFEQDLKNLLFLMYNPPTTSDQVAAEQQVLEGALQFATNWLTKERVGPLVAYNGLGKFIGCCSLMPSTNGVAGKAELYVVCTPESVEEYYQLLLDILRYEFAPAVAQHGYLFNNGPLKTVELCSRCSISTVPPVNAVPMELSSPDEAPILHHAEAMDATPAMPAREDTDDQNSLGYLSPLLLHPLPTAKNTTN